MLDVGPEADSIRAGAAWVAILCMDRDVPGWLATVSSFSAACDRVVITIAAPYVAEAEAAASQHNNVDVVSLTLSDTVAKYLDGARALVIVREPAVVSPDAFDRAREIVEADLRVATVSFFSNDGDYLSVPHRNQPQLLAPTGQNERSVTRVLRSDPLLMGPVPIPVPAGVVVCITATAVKSLGPLLQTAATTEIAVLDLALRAMSRGMRNVLDPSTYVVRVPARVRQVEVLHDPTFRSVLHERYHYFPALYDHSTTDLDEPLAGAITLARTSMDGLSVLIDGSMLGPFEMGTQVQILNLVSALAEHPDVRRVQVGIPGAVPAYAERHLMSPKVSIAAGNGLEFQVSERVDIIHRPCQPGDPIPWGQWRQIAHRTVLSVLDVIAYNNGAYFPSPGAWMEYRSNFRGAIRAVDGIVTISSDVADSVMAEQMPIDRDSIRVVPLGADHNLVPGDPARPPQEFLDRGMAASSFIFVLGASYSHKNRDLAIEAWRELRRRGFQEKLVLAGVVVPYGSTRNEESRVQLALDDELKSDLLIFPDVAGSERHWLLTHTSLVLYPSSAEGFGLVPFEAAQCGTPTLFVPFGPLSEFMPDIPVAADGWSPTSLADAAEQLLRDPALARAQVESVKSVAKTLTWEAVADQTVRFYRELLGRPAMGR